MAKGIPLPGLKELTDYGKRAARAAALLGDITDADVDVATTPRETIVEINGRTLYRRAAGRATVRPSWTT